jgi:Na+-driven multidrug efflux pump
MQKVRSSAENILGTKPVPKLVITSGIPLILSLLVNSMYNFVDSIFVSYISEDALVALSLAVPVQYLMSALGCGNAVGLNAVVSRALGRKDAGEVRRATSASLFIAGASWIIIVIAALVALRPFCLWQAEGNAVIAEYCITYLQICMFFSFGQMGQWVFDRLVIASGRSGLFLVTLSAISVTNLILDPILIFGYLGFPAMGVQGAAAATVIGQIIGCVTGYVINNRYNREIPVHFTLKPASRSIKDILRVGIPTTIVRGCRPLSAWR